MTEATSPFIFSEEYYDSPSTSTCDHRFSGDVSLHSAFYSNPGSVAMSRENSARSNGENESRLVNPRTLGLTYNPGDRLYFDNYSPQDEERHGELLRPVQAYVRTPSPGNYALHATEPAFAPNELQYSDPNAVFDPAYDAYSNYAASAEQLFVPELPIDPQLAEDMQNNLATVSPRYIPPLDANILDFFECPECGPTNCRTVNSLKRHIDRHNATTYTCPHDSCPYSSKKQTDIERHVNSKHLNKRSFACTRCGRSFPRKDNCDRHFKKCKKNIA